MFSEMIHPNPKSSSVVHLWNETEKLIVYFSKSFGRSHLLIRQLILHSFRLNYKTEYEEDMSQLNFVF